MNTQATPPPVAYTRSASPVVETARAAGRLAGIFAIGCMLAGGATYEHSMAEERAERRDQVGDELAQGIGGAQTVVGPLLYVEVLHKQTKVQPDVWSGPNVVHQKPAVTEFTERFVVAPEELHTTAHTQTSLRHRGVFDVPAYSASSSSEVRWKMPERVLKQAALDGVMLKDEVSIANSKVIFSVSSPDGLEELPLIRAGGADLRLEPGDLVGLGAGTWQHAALPKGALESGVLTGQMQTRFQGTRGTSWTPVAAMQSVDLTGNWSSPKFDGLKLPRANEVRADGFMASWATVPASRQIAALTVLGETDTFSRGDSNRSFGVQFFQPVDIYAFCVRSTKYGMMFVLVTLGGLMLVEALTKRRVSLGAHALVGTSLSLFFVLLLAYAEHIGFGRAYAVASAACVFVNGAFLMHVLRSKKIGSAFAATLAGVYGAMYVMLRSEDSALLMGSSLLFVFVTLAMFLVRNMMADRSPAQHAAQM